MPVRSVILDGEGVICGPDGVSDFDLMRAVFSRKGSPDVFLYAFDVLELDGRDLRAQRLVVRELTVGVIEVAVAREAGAEVRSETHQGKGHVVRRMFADVDADIYVLVDGDATYDAPSAPSMIDRLINEHLDMVVGFRVDQSVAAYRPGHRTGNWMLTSFLAGG